MDKQPHTQEFVQDANSYLLRRIIDLCAPVLTGVKPAALVSFHQEHRNLNLVWNENRAEYEKNALLSRLEFCELRKNPRETLVLFYHPAHLAVVMADQGNRQFLNNLDYPSDLLSEILTQIRFRFQDGCPHEVGIMLGIPLWDVTGFITNRGRNYLFNGYWKVYYHPEQALRTFFLYDQARREAGKLLTETTRPQPFCN